MRNTSPTTVEAMWKVEILHRDGIVQTTCAREVPPPIVALVREHVENEDTCILCIHIEVTVTFHASEYGMNTPDYVTEERVAVGGELCGIGPVNKTIKLSDELVEMCFQWFRVEDAELR
jgi:hypothetical protein